MNGIATIARTLLVALFAGLLAFAPAHAASMSTITTTITVEWVEEDAGDSAAWESDEGDDAALVLLADDQLSNGGASQHFVSAPRTALARPAATAAHYGPFTVVSPTQVRMAGDVTSATPRQFAAMLAAHPGLRQIDMIDCPGSLDEAANLRLARMIRAAGLSTHVPDGGSVRSGAVELWLAGVRRTAADTAEFGVHSWRDEDGLEARDYPANHPVHREYLDFYREVGLDARTAQAFYAMTNAAPFDAVQMLGTRDIARYVPMN